MIRRFQQKKISKLFTNKNRQRLKFSFQFEITQYNEFLNLLRDMLNIMMNPTPKGKRDLI